MALGSFSSSALYELDDADVDRMLGLNETLFVEHKAGIGTDDESFKLLQAIAAFANTAGGWILLGVHESKIVANNESVWAKPNAPQIVDMVRDRLRGRLDPLPSFEAKVMADHYAGPVAVVRVYESSDTPHTALRNGAVYVREVAGVRDATTPKRSGSGSLAERAYKAVTIGSRADLLQLAARGQIADQRVSALLNTAYLSPLVARLGLAFHPVGDGLRPRSTDHALVHVRIAPYTLPARFRGWSTTLDAAGAVLRAAENLANSHGLMSDWVTPHPAGVSIEVPHTDPAPHTDRWTHADAYARVVIDGMGLSGAALKLEAPPPQNRRRQFDVDQIARTLILPVIRAAAAVLGTGEFTGRCRCQIDLVGVQHVAMLESQSDHQAVDDWVPTTIDITLTATDDELARAALTAARSLARSAGLAFWD